MFAGECKGTSIFSIGTICNVWGFKKFVRGVKRRKKQMDYIRGQKSRKCQEKTL